MRHIGICVFVMVFLAALGVAHAQNNCPGLTVPFTTTCDCTNTKVNTQACQHASGDDVERDISFPGKYCGSDKTGECYVAFAVDYCTISPPVRFEDLFRDTVTESAEAPFWSTAKPPVLRKGES
jgi:hypothetical protein